MLLVIWNGAVSNLVIEAPLYALLFFCCYTRYQDELSANPSPPRTP
jgi:hypothetical protein